MPRPSNPRKAFKEGRTQKEQPKARQTAACLVADMEEPLSDYSTFKTTLLNKQAELFRQSCESRQEITVQHNADPLDEILHSSNRELAIRGLDLKARLMRDVRSALLRLGEGTFGRCGECGKPIPLKRLNAVPWAPYCLTCQELADKESGTADEEESTPTNQ